MDLTELKRLYVIELRNNPRINSEVTINNYVAAITKINNMKIEINVRYFMIQDFDEEIWKRIKGFHNYKLSNYGRVKNINLNKIMKPYIVNKSESPKYSVILSGKNKRVSFYLNDLIISTFNNKYRTKVVEYKDFVYNKNDEFIFNSF